MKRLLDKAFLGATILAIGCLCFLPTLGRSTTTLPWPAASLTAGTDCSSVAGLEFWYRADTVTFSSGAKVSSWTDRSGHSRNASNANTAQQPSQVSSVINGQPVIRFSNANGTNLVSSPFTIPSPSSILIFAKGDSSINRWFNSKTLSADGQSFFPSSATTLRFSENVSITSTDYVAGAFALWQGTFITGTNNSYLVKNAGVATFGTPSDPFFGVNIGSYFGTTLPADVDIAEICIYSVNLTGADQTAVRGYFTARYGIP